MVSEEGAFIVLVDDEPRIHEMVRAVLEESDLLRRFEGYDEPVLFIESLSMEREAPDLVLLDVHFENSGLTGLDVLPFIREQYPYLPVVLLTGMEGELIEKAQDFDFTYFIPKPVTPELLARMVRFYLGSGKKSGERMAEMSQDISEYEALLDTLEQELENVKQAQSSAATQERSGKPFERLKDLVTVVLKNCDTMDSFFSDLERIYVSDFKLMKRAMDGLIQFDQAEGHLPGFNVHKYIDLKLDNVYSFRISRKARVFFYRSTKTNRKRLLRLDNEHDTHGMIKWLRSNYDTYRDA